MKAKTASDEKNLTRRYLLWCYKTTKEELERIDRKFTQLVVDDFVLKSLLSKESIKDTVEQAEYRKEIEDFKEYIDKKRKDAFSQKYSGKNKKSLNPHYLHLQNRLTAVEKAICRFFGKKELTTIATLYQEEMTKRILEAREH